MKAIMEHDTSTSIVFWSINGLYLSYSIPRKITEITEIVDYEDGFITMNTNYGEEYTDLIDLMEHGNYSESLIDKAKNIFKKLKKENIELKRS